MTWGDVIEKAESERFIGREQELFAFKLHIERNPPRYLIFFISGQGGAGKSSLLNRCRDVSQDLGMLLADCDEQQTDIPAVLGRFAQQMAEQGFTLKKFDERYKVYRQKMDEIEHDPDAPQGLAGIIGRTLVRGVFLAGDMVPGVRKGLEYVPKETQELLENQASDWSSYLVKKITNKDEITLIKEPISILTPLFFKDLNEIAEKRRILLCFENFEETRVFLQAWILRFGEYKPSQNIRIAIASRNPPGAKWDILRPVTLPIQLDIFSEQEAEHFLDVYGITDAKRRSEILDFSGRLPVLMSWLAATESNESDSTVPASDIVDRFLRWVSKPEYRLAALYAALPRKFNLDTIKSLLGSTEETFESQSAFNWLKTMPFVKAQTDGWQYHTVVRRMMLFYQRQESPESYKRLHAQLANFYDKERDALKLSFARQWSSEDWRKTTLSYIYHFLIADPQKHWPEVMNLFVMAISIRLPFAQEIIELLCLDETRDELSEANNTILSVFQKNLQIIRDDVFEKGFDLFDDLSRIEGISSQARSFVFSARASCLSKLDRQKEALSDLNKAIELNPSNVWAMSQRGDVYEELGRYSEALSDFNKIIKLDKDNHWAFESKGSVQIRLGHYQEAVHSLTRADKILPDCPMCILHRADAYYSLKQYANALSDCNRVIEIKPEYAMGHRKRAEVSIKLGYYEEAIRDLLRMISLESEALHGGKMVISKVMLLLGRYEDANNSIVDALQVNPSCAHCWSLWTKIQQQIYGSDVYSMRVNQVSLSIDDDALRTAYPSIPYLLTGDYQEALTSIDAAISIKKELNTEWSYYRGMALSSLGRYEEAVKMFEIKTDNSHDYIVSYNRAVTMFRWKGKVGAKSHMDEAYVELQKAKTTEPTLYYYGLGGLEALNGNLDKALSYLDQALLLDESAYLWASLDLAWLELRKNPRFLSLMVRPIDPNQI